MRFKNIATFLLLIFFALPAATAFCCCTDFSADQPRQENLRHHHGSSESGHNHAGHHQHGKEKNSTGDSCECGSEILGNLATRAADLNFANTHLSSYQINPLFAPLVAISDYRQSEFSFQDTGPPGIFSTSTPLYLRLSVLRI